MAAQRTRKKAERQGLPRIVVLVFDHKSEIAIVLIIDILTTVVLADPKSNPRE